MTDRMTCRKKRDGGTGVIYVPEFFIVSPTHDLHSDRKKMGSDQGQKSHRGRIFQHPFLLIAIPSFCIGAILSWLVITFRYEGSNEPLSYLGVEHDSGKNNNDCVISLGSYRGPEYRTTSTVGKPQCLVESKFLKIQQHTVSVPSSSPQGTTTSVIDDWLFIDYHERINVLVEAPRQSGWTEPHFYLFEQTKYALEGRMSLAIVGGIIEPGEAPLKAAQREVKEEMRVACQHFHFLGRYRTDVNRGGGWTHSYLALSCSPTSLQIPKGVPSVDEVGAKDTELQDIRSLSLSSLQDALLKGKLLEIQWTATVSLAIIYLSSVKPEGD